MHEFLIDNHSYVGKSNRRIAYLNHLFDFNHVVPCVIQAMVKSADKLAFITGNDKYLTGVEGSIPVIVKSVRKKILLLQI